MFHPRYGLLGQVILFNFSTFQMVRCLSAHVVNEQEALLLRYQSYTAKPTRKTWGWWTVGGFVGGWLNRYLAYSVYVFCFVTVKRKSWKVRMDPSQDPTAAFSSGLIVAGSFDIWCTKQSSPYWHCCPTLTFGHRPWSHYHWFIVLSLHPCI